MKSFYLVFCSLLIGAFSANAQDASTDVLKPTTMGFGLALFDFTTPQRIRSSSLASTINNKRIAKISDFAPGAAFYYVKGLRPKLDFASSIGFGSGRVYLENNPEKVRNTSFLYADAGVQLKLLTEQYAVNPFVSAGLGATVTKGFYGAIIPIGVGIRFRISDEASLVMQSQYRSAITETAGYHIFHGITIMGKL